MTDFKTMPGAKYRALYSEDSGWYVQFGPRRPIRDRRTIASGLTQTIAESMAARLNAEMILRAEEKKP